MPIDQKSHLNEVEFNRPGFHKGKLVWVVFPQFTRHFLTSQFDGYPPLDLLHKIQYTPPQRRTNHLRYACRDRDRGSKSSVFPD